VECAAKLKGIPWSDNTSGRKTQDMANEYQSSVN